MHCSGIEHDKMPFRSQTAQKNSASLCSSVVVWNMGVPGHFPILWLRWPSRMHIYGSVGPL